MPQNQLKEINRLKKYLKENKTPSLTTYYLLLTTAELKTKAKGSEKATAVSGNNAGAGVRKGAAGEIHSVE